MRDQTYPGGQTMQRSRTAQGVMDRNASRGSLLTVGFGTSVVMWAAAYIGLAPWWGDSTAEIWVLVVVLGLLMAVAGLALARLTGGGPAAGAKLGLVLTGINFIIVASLNSRDTTREALLNGLLWIAGFAVAAVVLCSAGALLAGGRGAARGIESRRVAWTSWFALIVAVTTLPLLVSGGVVTGLEAGMAVPDWLTTFDYPMMFYPMVKMQADTHIYAEHFHRLWGLLVGLSVIALAVQVHRADSRRSVRFLSLVVLGMVIVQGVLGGTRVTENNLALAIVHGVFGQAVFAMIACVAAMCSEAWKDAAAATGGDALEHAASDARLVTGLAAMLVAQLVLGALYRHLNASPAVPTGLGHGLLGLHVLLACVIAVVVVMAGLRMMGLRERSPVLPRLGISLKAVLGVQFLLGVGAMLAVLTRGGEGDIPAVEVMVTTAHQTIGAVFLALAVAGAMWMWRAATIT